MFQSLVFFLKGAFRNLYLFLCTDSVSCGTHGSFSLQAIGWVMWDLVPWPGVKSWAPALGVWGSSHWTDKEIWVTCINWSWIFIGRTDVEAETPILWPPHAKSWLIGKDPDAGRDWGQEEKGTTEDEMAGWHHQLDGHEFGWTPGVGDGQGGLACCSSWGRKESDVTERLNWT